MESKILQKIQQDYPSVPADVAAVVASLIGKIRDSSAILGLLINIFFILAGITVNSRITSRYFSSAILPFSFASVSASMVSTVTCPVNALVDATPISGPT